MTESGTGNPLPADWLRPEWPAPPAVQALSTTRQGGVSTGPWASNNLGQRCGDQPQAVASNRQQLREFLPAEPRWLQQVHGRQMLYLEQATGPEAEADGAWTDRPGVVCAILHADCLPVLLCRQDGRAVAALHAGWRGLAQGIVGQSLASLPGSAAEWMAWLGPAIGPGAFEVGGEVREAFIARDPELDQAFIANRPGHWLADLYNIARHDLAQAGVEQVYGGGFCTHSDSQRFFSHRRGAPTGRMASLIWLEDSRSSD